MIKREYDLDLRLVERFFRIIFYMVQIISFIWSI